ncbi:hypothetical protein [Saccharopolyspora cebuensis]
MSTALLALTAGVAGVVLLASGHTVLGLVALAVMAAIYLLDPHRNDRT